MVIFVGLSLLIGVVALWYAAIGLRERVPMLERLEALEKEVRRLNAQIAALQSTAAAAVERTAPAATARVTAAPTDFILPPAHGMSPVPPATPQTPAPAAPVAAPPSAWREVSLVPGAGGIPARAGRRMDSDTPLRGGHAASEGEAPASAVFPEAAAAPPVSVETRLGQWLGWLAAITVVLTVGLFIKWTHDIGVLSRVPAEVYIGMGWLTGMVLLGCGERFRRALPLYGQGLTGAGVAALYVATYAGHRYDVLSAATASIGLVLVGALAIWLALRQDSPAIGWIGIVLAYASPVLVGGSSSGPEGLFVYLTALNSVVLAVSIARQWIAFRSVAFICSGLLYVAWYAGKFSAASAEAAALFLLVNWAIFVAVLAAYPLLRKEPTRDSDLALAALNPFFTAVLLYPVLERFYPQWTGAAAAFFAGCYWLLSYAIRARRLWGLTEEERDAEEAEPSPPDYLEQLFYSAACVFAVLMVPLQLHGRSITAGWALMGAALYVSGFRTSSRRTQYWATVPLALALARLALYDAGLPSSAAVLFNTRGFSFGVVLLSLLTVGATLARDWLKAGRPDDARRAALTLLTLLIGTLFNWWIYLDVPRAWYPAGWAAVAALALAYGWRLRCADVRVAGLVLALAPLGVALTEPGWATAPDAPAAVLPGWLSVLALSLGLAVLYEWAGEQEISERWLSPLLGAAACMLLFLRAYQDATAVWLPVAFAAIAAGALAAATTTLNSGHRAVGLSAGVVAVAGLLGQLALGQAPVGEWWMRAPGYAATLALCLGVAWSHLRREPDAGEVDRSVGVAAAGAAAMVAMVWGAVELGPGWLPAAFLAVVVALLWAGTRLQLPALRVLAAVGAALLTCEVLVRELSLPAAHGLLLHSRSAAGLSAITAWAAVAWAVYRKGGDEERRWVPFLALVTNVHALGWISLEAMDVGSRLGGGPWGGAAGQFGLSAAWLVYAAGAIGLGFWRDHSAVRWGGAALLLLTVAKVYLIDLSFLATGYRVLSFLTLGLVLLGVSYLYHRRGAAARME